MQRSCPQNLLLKEVQVAESGEGVGRQVEPLCVCSSSDVQQCAPELVQLKKILMVVVIAALMRSCGGCATRRRRAAAKKKKRKGHQHEVKALLSRG